MQPKSEKVFIHVEAVLQVREHQIMRDRQETSTAHPIRLPQPSRRRHLPLILPPLSSMMTKINPLESKLTFLPLQPLLLRRLSQIAPLCMSIILDLKNISISLILTTVPRVSKHS